MITLQAETTQALDSTVNFGLSQFLAIFDWGYIFSVIFFVALFFKFVVGNLPKIDAVSRISKIWVVVVLGVLLGWLWMKVGETTWTKMIVSFPFAVLLHKALLAKLLQFLRMEERTEPKA